ncbi:MAG TPA: DegT/DnrJ/EryC1/StrS family aminotransferase [Gemmatimonadales bacterium]|nr:DegT/DnrJ/EryC1/StrS family aminotransferase [Gemmatimonadales bacterium]
MPAEAPLFFRGAGALLYGARQLRDGSRDEIIAPTFHCGVEIEALLQAGARVRFAPLNEGLGFDQDRVRAIVTPRTRGILAIHYFGFPQHLQWLRDFCDEFGLALIEDCAHALFSRDDDSWLGTRGDMAIFSFQKSLPVPDGGALVWRTGPIHAALERPPALTTARSLALLCLASWRTQKQGIVAASAQTVARGIGKLGSRMLKALIPDRRVYSPSTTQLDPAVDGLAISPSARAILTHVEPETIVQSRRRNFAILVEELASAPGVVIPFKDLPTGTCPLFLPLLVRQRNLVRARLSEASVECFVFGESPHDNLGSDQCAVASRWSRENLCLPVHQDLTDSMIEYMVRAVRSSLRA